MNNNEKKKPGGTKCTTLCYIENNERWLMLYRNRKPDDPNAGKWLGIGGKIEDGESADDCCKREVLEETGLVLNSFEFHGVIKFRATTYEDEDMYLYTSRDFTPADEEAAMLFAETGEYDPPECGEGVLSWIAKDDVPGLPMWEGDRAFIERLLEGAGRISMTLQYTGENCKIIKDERDARGPKGACMKDYIERIKNAEELCWINPNRVPAEEALMQTDFNADDIADAESRLKRFAPLIMHYFPETKADGGIIESPLTEIADMKEALNADGARLTGRLFLKRDSDLKVSGSVKARGGVYEVLKHAEDIAIEEGMLYGIGDDYMKLATDASREAFSKHKIQVGSTGNLGMSIGIMSAALGFEVIVHMSEDAKQWKKDLLRERGATVIEYEGDYSAAVEQGRAESDEDPASYFIDDENSKDLFLGYAVAAGRLKKQLNEQDIKVDENHPLFVYLPCGVGGAPGGITFGLKLLFGDNVHCFFAETVDCPCMLVGLETGEMNNICVQDVGLSGKTEADGLACQRPSGLVARMMDKMMSGEFTVKDERLGEYLKNLYKNEMLYIEPSACAGFIGPCTIGCDEDARRYLRQNELEDKMADATHVCWATGGSMVPQEIRDKLLKG